MGKGKLGNGVELGDSFRSIMEILYLKRPQFGQDNVELEARK